MHKGTWRKLLACVWVALVTVVLNAGSCKFLGSSDEDDDDGPGIIYEDSTTALSGALPEDFSPGSEVVAQPLLADGSLGAVLMKTYAGTHGMFQLPIADTQTQGAVVIAATDSGTGATLKTLLPLIETWDPEAVIVVDAASTAQTDAVLAAMAGGATLEEALAAGE